VLTLYQVIQTITSAGDNLGNHTATQDLNLAGNDIILSSDGDTKFNVVGATVLFQCSNSGSSAEVFRIGATELQMAKNIDMDNNKVINLATPTSDYDASTKKYVDDQIAGVSSGANTDLSNLTSTGESHFVKANASSTTFAGNVIFDTVLSGSTTSAPVKFQGDGGTSAQRVLEIGEYGNHSVKFIAELEGDTGRQISNPDGGSDIDVPGSDPSLSIKSAVIMNTYTMYDLDTLVFSQSGSSTTPPPEDDWVYIEANTGTSGSPNLTGMTYNVPTSKTHQFKVNGSLKISIDDDIEFETGSTLNFKEFGNPSSWTTGGGTALPSNPTAYFKVKYNGADRYIPYYTAS